MQRQRTTDRRHLIDVPMEIQKEDAMELEKVKEGMVSSLEKTKFGRKATEDMELMINVDEVMDSEALMIGEILISLNCSTVSLTCQLFSSKKKNRGRPSRGRREAPDHREKCGPRWSYHTKL